MLVGGRYLPYRHEGDKNFWIEFVESLKQELESILIISVNRDNRGIHFPTPNIRIRNISPFLFPDTRSKFSDRILGFSNNYVSKSFSFLKIYGQISKVLKEESFEVVHFMDNYGPLMFQLKTMKKIPLSIFAPTYDPRYPQYDYFLKLSFVPFRKVITTTYAFKRKLIGLGFPGDRIEVIRWGVNTDKLKPDSEMKEQIRIRLAINPNSKVILWSGFLQQTSIKEFQYSLKIAEDVLKKKNDCTFIFAFKHVYYKREYSGYEKKGIKILKTKSNTEFLKLVNACDIFLSPILAQNSIVAPPLTWIECMAYGVPVMTTKVGGVNELILNSRTGYIFNTIKEASDIIQKMVDDESSYRRISKDARIFVRNNYEIKEIANKYIELWTQLSEQG